MYEAALAFSVLCFLVVCGIYWRSPAFSMFHPLTFYLAFHGILFVFRPIIAWAGEYQSIYRAYQFNPSMSDKITVLLASSLGMIVFAFFSLRAGSAPMRFGEDAAIREERRRLTQIFAWVIAICGPLAVYSLIRAYGANSTASGMVLDRATGVTINTTTVGYFTDMQLMLVSLCAISIWLARFRLWSFLPLIGFVALRAGTGGRGPFVAAVVATGLFYLYEKRIRYPGIRVVLASAFLLAAFSAVGADRGAGVRQALGIEEADSFAAREDGERFMEGMDFGNMEYFEYLVYAIPQRSGTYNFFINNLQIFTEPIPRLLWPGKPIGEPFPQMSLYDYGYPIGMTKSVPGEGWYSLGWLGVIIWCALWGHALGRIYTRFVTGDQTTLKTAAYMAFLPILIVALRDGLLLSLLRQSGVYLMPVFVWFVARKYLGIPTAADLRARMAANGPVDDGDAGQGEDAAAPRSSGLDHLPPAVRRRRLALAAQSPSTKPE